VQRAISDMQTTPSDIKQRLTLGVTETISAYLAPAVLSAVHERFPGLDIRLVESSRPAIEQALLNGQMDLAMMIVSNLTPDARLEYQAMLKSPRRLWTHPDHELQQQSQITLHDIAQYDYLLLD